MRTDGRTDRLTDIQKTRQRDMTKRLAAFRSFANASKQGSNVGRRQVAVLPLTLLMPDNTILWASRTNLVCLETLFNYIASVGFAWQENGNNFATNYFKY
jgi:hypothetical protein